MQGLVRRRPADTHRGEPAEPRRQTKCLRAQAKDNTPWGGGRAGERPVAGRAASGWFRLFASKEVSQTDTQDILVIALIDTGLAERKIRSQI